MAFRKQYSKFLRQYSSHMAQHILETESYRSRSTQVGSGFRCFYLNHLDNTVNLWRVFVSTYDFIYSFNATFINVISVLILQITLNLNMEIAFWFFERHGPSFVVLAIHIFYIFMIIAVTKKA